jgi:hypothetical protein
VWIGRIEEFFMAAELGKLRTVTKEHPVKDGKEWPIAGWHPTPDHPEGK